MVSRSTNQTIRESWGGDSPQEAAARARLVDATARCIVTRGMAATSVAAIAEEAGVSRQTVYRYFSGRDHLVFRTMRRAAEAVGANIVAILHPLHDPADMVVEALVYGLDAVRHDEVLRAAWESGADGTVSEFTGPAGIEWLRETLDKVVTTAGWSEPDAAVRLELVIRMFVSLLVSPSPERSADELRSFFYRHLVPGLGLGETEPQAEDS